MQSSCSRSHGIIASLLVLALAALLLDTPSAKGPTTHAAVSSEALEWGACPDAGVDPRQECALLEVPLDYDNPSASSIEIAVSRVAATDATIREGVLLFNPGGPGGQGLNLPSAFAQLLDPEIVARFDLIGFDPRFIGRSTPVTCALTLEQQLLLIPWPLPGGIEENLEAARELSDACAASAGEMLVHGTTANTARDMDRIRRALGEKRISYVGYSYGSYLGAVYASLFPERTDRFVLDSVVNPYGIWRNVFRSWGPAIEIRFPDLTGWIAERNDVYGLGETSSDVRGRYFELASRLDAEPLELPDGTVVTGNLFREASRGALYDDRLFAPTAELWQSVAAGTAGVATATLDPEVMALFPEIPDDNAVAGALAVLCDDAEWPRNLRSYERAVRIDSHLFPVAGPMAANVWACAAWAHEPVDRLVAITGNGPPNVLLVQNERDPATPYFGALGMWVALGDRSRLVTVEAGGHGVFAFDVNTCADETTNRFLLSGSLPERNPVCPSDPADLASRALTASRAEAIRAVRKEMWPF